MGGEKINFVRNCHCPECNGMYIIIDNEIISCPVCELKSNQNLSKMYDEEAGKELVQFKV
ncbi:MAG: hypothetical protein HWN81_21390 [Candidatus Lokiarchaeota archaeon]|nr:hypothetical protein [Candidatus Lokiarchaeota archaeon]